MSVVLLLYLTMLLWLVLQFCELYVCHPISNTILHLKMHSTSQLGMHWTVTAYIFEPLYWMNLGEMSTVVAVLFQIYQKYYDAISYCRRHTCWQSQTIRYETSQSLQNTRCWMFYAFISFWFAHFAKLFALNAICDNIDNDGNNQAIQHNAIPYRTTIIEAVYDFNYPKYKFQISLCGECVSVRVLLPCFHVLMHNNYMWCNWWLSQISNYTRIYAHIDIK